ncbi:MAG: cytochrome P450 [Chloroflexi bacterium]|nr:cytochrome P450 [Chloroflexota bacterium]MYF82244.1 cytochrome P450 [Chloroflexota bacterium]MYI03577.1 cytochrome P450 [Chloroflexota bacterium]
MTTMTSGLDQVDLVTPERYAERGYPWDDWKLLRREAPVYWYDQPGVTPFWAITKYDDIQQISRDPETFISSQRLVIRSAGSGDGGANDPSLTVPNLINMDPPEHGKYRNATSRRFSPRGMRLLEDRVDEIAEDVIDEAAAHLVSQLTDRREMDFVRDVAAKMPMAAICEILAVDRDSWEDIFLWTNEFIGSEDPEYQQGRSRRETWQSGMRGLQGYFMAHIERKRREPDESVMTTLVQAEIDGEPLPEHEILSYAILLILAGNETTRNATSGGMQALIEHPDQFELLRSQPELLDSAVEEMLRWTSPVVHFARTVTQDTEIRGVPIREGETLAMWYPSANRDEDIFDNPDAFDIQRSPNDHLAFGGFGEHFCLGANLARLEMRSIFRHLIQKLDHFQMNGDTERLSSGLIGGIKRLPVSYAVRE